MTKQTKLKIDGRSSKPNYLPPTKRVNLAKSTLITKNEMPDYMADVKKLESEAWGYRQLLNPEMLVDHGDLKESYAKYPIITDRQTGLKCHAKVSKVYWLEKTIKRVKNKVSESVKSVPISPADLLTRNITLKESLSKGKAKMLEAVEVGWAEGNDSAGAGNGGPLGFTVAYPPGPFTRQLYLQDMWNMQARCFTLYNHYGIAKSAVNTISYFVIGEGIKVDFDDDQAQEVWDEFCERTHLDRDWQEYCMMLCVNGELVFHMPSISVKGEGGYTDLVSIDPGTLWEIVTDPKDIRKVKLYWIQYATQYQLFTVGDLPTAEYVIEQIKPEEIIMMKVNVQKNEKRGRSDLLASLADAKMLQDIMQYRSVRVINEAALVFDQKITGNDTDVSNIAGIQTDFLGAGTTYTHNESSEMEIKQASSTAQTKSGFHDEMLSQIATGTGSMPSDFIGGGGQGSRASALTKTEPSYKFFRSRQKKIEFTVKDMAKIVLANWNLANGTNLPADCEVIFPEIAPEDRKDKLANIVLMESQEYWTHEKAAETAAKEMDDTSYDYDQTQETIKQERLNDPQLAFLFQPQAPGAVGGTQNPGPAPQGTNAPKPAVAGTQPELGQPARGQGQYDGKKMGMSSSTKGQIKKTIKQRETFLFEKERKELHGTKKAGHKMMHDGLRARTKHTIKAAEEGEESMGSGSMPAQMRLSANDLSDLYGKIKKEKHPYAEMDWKETAPPGWDDTIHAMPDSVGNKFALAWYMDNQGYTPHK